MSILLRKGVRAELHVYTKGGHGFDSGVERGHSVAGWRDSFLAWLEDQGRMSH